MKEVYTLSELRPDLAAQWSYDDNYPYTPDTISAKSHQKFVWVCSKGHKWAADPEHRMRSHAAECPYCNGNRVISGENDLATLYPRLKEEWNYSKNGELNPRLLHRSSNKKVWWICAKGHEWRAQISHRTLAENATTCPFCAGRRAIQGVNDLASQRPDIAEQWDFTANAPLMPSQVTVSSGKRVQWRCKAGHTWKTSVSHRTERKKATNCPYCSGRKAIPGKTDLATLYPDLMQEWNYDLNTDLDPSKLRPHSNRKAHWICREGHRWVSVIGRRTAKNGSGCPYCWGRRAIPGKTDLQTKYPQIARELDREATETDPSTISYASNRKEPWICEIGHRWEATIASRTLGGNNCPVCNGRRPDVGVNDFATMRPDLVLDWNNDCNGEHRPEDYLPNASYIASWSCHVCGKRWKKSILARHQGSKCPKCYRERKRRAKL